ncbi:hypothetical protein HZH66_006941 [Vespula vulgaris]|uniref:Polyamine-modulated factor 1 n=1 Tax=Vespula vulgaris TaxID=7454 RepID=A0A834K646_VESVU|nr:uncharacterized protein LOC127064699 isoform X2 [Vespula vulgaris]KAF7399044.1 hypothetical protein HZH66_006941 [Vespula vulgaris]
MSQEEEVLSEKNEVPHANNALLFRLAITKSFENISESVSKEEFLELLTIIKKQPSSSLGRKLYKAMVDELLEKMNDQLKEIYQEGSLEAGLTKLSKLSEEAGNTVANETVWRPPGDVKLHLRSLDAEKIKMESEKLEEWLTEIENENATLMKKLANDRTKVCTTGNRIAKNLHRAPMIQEHLENQVEQLQHLLRVLEGD